MHRTFKRLNRITNDVVQGCIARDWDEDFITRDLLRTLRANFNNIEIEGLNYPIHVLNGGAYKLTGTQEHDFGDIAIIFLFRLISGKEFYGCAFLEAKKRDLNSPKFPAVKTKQLETILSNAGTARLLLYDTDLSVPSVPVGPSYPLPFSLHDYLHGGPEFALWENLPRSCIYTLPISLALQVGDFTTGLLRFSLPFSYQFMLRYIMGFDLEFSKKALNIATGKDPAYKPDFILVYKVMHGVDILPDGIEINGQFYQALE